MGFPAHHSSPRTVLTVAAQFLCVLATFCCRSESLLADASAHKLAPINLNDAIDLGRIKEGEIKEFSPEGRLLAATASGTFVSVGPVRLWDLRSAKELTPVAADWKQLDIVRFSPDGKLVAAHDKKEGIGVWDALTGKPVMAFRPKNFYGNCVNFWFSPDGKALIYEHYGEKFPDDQTFNVREIGAARDRASFTGQPYMMQLSADGKIGTGTTATTHDKRDRVLLWEWKDDKPPVLAKDYRVRVDHVAFSPDLSSFVTADGADVRIVDMSSGRERMTFSDESKETHIQGVEFSANGKLLIVNSGGGTQLNWKTRSTVWDVSGRKARRVSEFVREPGVSADGRYLAGALSESDAPLVEVATGRTVGRLTEKGDLTSSHFFT